MHKHRARRVTMAGWLIAGKMTYVKKPRPRPMKFLSMEDLTATFEVTLFPDAYRRFGRLLRSAGPFLIKGKVEDQYGALTITAAFLDYLLPQQKLPLRTPAASHGDDSQLVPTSEPLAGLFPLICQCFLDNICQTM